MLYHSQENRNETRMHSSRMRTGRSLTVCWGVSLPGGLLAGGLLAGGSPCRGGFPCWGGGVFLLGGGSPCRGVSLPGGCSLLGGFSLPGGLSARGFSLPGDESPCWWGSPCLGSSPCWRPPLVNKMTDMSKKHNLGHNFVAAGKNR